MLDRQQVLRKKGTLTDGEIKSLVKEWHDTRSEAELNNATVEMEMKAAGLVETGVALDNPDFAAMARSIGIHGVRVSDPGDLDTLPEAPSAPPLVTP